MAAAAAGAVALVGPVELVVWSSNGAFDMRYEIFDTHGIVENVIEAEAGFMAAQYPEGNYRQAEAQHESAPAAAAHRLVTVGAFKSRLSADERKAIRALARLDADVEDYMDILDSSRYVDLDDPRTRGGLQLMEAAGVLAPGRALEILDAPVQAWEQP